MGGQGTVPRGRRPALAVATLALAALALLGAGCSGGQEVRAADAAGVGGTTPTTAVPSTAGDPQDGGLELTVDADGATRAVRVVVDDPAAPDGPTSRQCVLVTVYGDATAKAEGFFCNRDADGAPYLGSSVAADGTVEVPMQAVDGWQIGSACTERQGEPEAPALDTAPTRAAFGAVLPAQLGPGTYRVVVAATSGVGPGCPMAGSPARSATQRAGEAEATITLG